MISRALLLPFRPPYRLPWASLLPLWQRKQFRMSLIYSDNPSLQLSLRLLPPLPLSNRAELQALAQCRYSPLWPVQIMDIPRLAPLVSYHPARRVLQPVLPLLSLGPSLLVILMTCGICRLGVICLRPSLLQAVQGLRRVRASRIWSVRKPQRGCGDQQHRLAVLDQGLLGL